MSVIDYTTKIKQICDALGSISVTMDEDEMVQIYLGSLAQKYGSIRTTIYMRENSPSFFYLQSMLLTEDNHMNASTGRHTNSKMLYAERPYGCGGCSGSVRNGGSRKE